MDNPFSWDYLTTRPGENEVFGPFAILYLIAFAVGFVASIIVYNGAARRLFPNPVIHKMARRWSAYAMTIFGLGLFFFAVRALQITMLTFEMRLWMWLCILAVGGLVVYAIWDYAKHYPAAMKKFEELQRKNQYIRANPGGTATVFPSAARPTKKRRA
jgi:hypothetical protein